MSVENKMLIYTSYLRPILKYACLVWSYATKSHVDLLIKSQNSTIWQILDMPWYIRNFHIYKDINIPRLNDFIQYLNLNFHLALENADNHALNTLVEYDHQNSINRKRPKTGLRLNILL